MDQTTLQDYMAYISAYDSLIAIAMSSGAILAFLYHRTRSIKRNGIRPGFNIWWILILGLMIRLPLMSQDVWYDETFTSAVTQLGAGDMMRVIQSDVHPPGYYFIVKTFTEVFGHNDITMRIPALLSSLALIYSMYLIGVQYGGKRVGLWVGIIVAVLPALSYYSSEARYPAFLALLLSISYVGIQRKNALMMSVPLAGVALTHVNGWIYIVLMGGVWALQNKRIRSLLIPSSAMIAWFPVALQQAGDVSNGFWLHQQMPFQHVMDMTITSKFVSANSALMPMIAVSAILFLSLWMFRKRADLLWMVCVVAVPLSQWMVGIIWNPIYLPRTLLFSALLLSVPVAWWLDRHGTVPVLIVGILAMTMGNLSLHMVNRGANADIAVSQCEGFSTIYVSNVKMGIIAQHYNRDAQVHVYSHGNTTAQQLNAAARGVMFEDERTLHTYERDTCVIARINAYSTPDEIRHVTKLTHLYHWQIVPENFLAYYVIMRGSQQ